MRLTLSRPESIFLGIIISPYRAEKGEYEEQKREGVCGSEDCDDDPVCVDRIDASDRKITWTEKNGNSHRDHHADGYAFTRSKF